LLAFVASTASADGAMRAAAEDVRERALADPLAWELLESLTTDVGPRPVGSAGMERAKEWAVARFQVLGFENISIESFEKKDAWLRGPESAQLTAPYSRELAVLGLGNSVPTIQEGVEAEIALIGSLAELRAMPEGSLAGRIAVLNWRFDSAQGEAGYRAASDGRRDGASIAAAKGAIGFMLRSAGTSSGRRAHTGVMRYAESAPRIPAAAIANPDADLLERLVARGIAVRLRLRLASRLLPSTTAWNVSGVFRGREDPDAVILVGGHLDSWDNSEGAADDAAGVAITMAAARLAAQARVRPRRTIRVVLWGSEETSGSSEAYAERHRDEIAHIVIAGESDLGAGRVYKIATSKCAWSDPHLQTLTAVLAPLGIQQDPVAADFGGVDIEHLRKAGVPVVRLSQDPREYFDVHHTADDTLNRINRRALDQNVAAWAALLYVFAESGVDICSHDD
jgi:hypothetical protein